MERSPSNLQVGVIGLGGAAERIHLPACHSVPGLEVIAGCDPLIDSAGVPRIYRSAEELFASAAPDVVIIATPPESHHSLCLMALEAGAHVFCEKPFMQTLEQADDVIRLAAARNLALAVNNQYRYMQIYRATRERLEAGDFGRLYAIQCWQQMFHPPALENVPWRQHLKQSTLYEFGTHALDLLCYLFGDLPLAVSSLMPRVRPEFDSDVLVQAALQFPDDRVATLWLNRVSHAPTRYLEMRLDCTEASIRISLGGVARASIEWLGRPSARLSLLRGGEARSESQGRSKRYSAMKQQPFMTATAAHLADFAARIQSGKLDLSAAEHARAVLRCALAGYRSAEQGGSLVRL